MRISLSEFQKEPERYQDAALQEPVAITTHGRDWLVLMSSELFREYQELKQRSRQVLASNELDDKDLEAIEAARVPSGQE